MSGFVALHREAFDHPLLRSGDRFRAWFWMVSKACWRPTKFDVAGKVILLERGQFCTSRAQLAEAWGWSPSAVERFLTRLETEQMIGRATGQGRSVVTIRNYDKYQDVESETGQASEQPTGQRSDSDRTTKEQGNKGTRVDPNGSTLPKRAHRIPSDWQPVLTPAAQRVVDGWPPGKYGRELASFLDHAADKGRTSKDWQAAFRTWITKAEEWSTNGRHSPAPRLSPDAGRGQRPNRCLDMLYAAEAEIGAASDPEPDFETRPALRAIGFG